MGATGEAQRYTHTNSEVIVKEVRYFEGLPETMSQVDVERELEELIDTKCNYQASCFLDALYEISSRQVLNYNLLRGQLPKRLSVIVLDMWNRESIDSTETCISIIFNLGLQSAWELIIENVNLIHNIKVRSEIVSAYKEAGDVIDDVSNMG